MNGLLIRSMYYSSDNFFLEYQYFREDYIARESVKFVRRNDKILTTEMSETTVKNGYALLYSREYCDHSV